MDREERQRERGMEKEKSQRREKTIKKVIVVTLVRATLAQIKSINR